MNDLPLALHQTVINHAPCGMALVDRNGIPLLVNTRIKDLLGVEDTAACVSRLFASAPEGALTGLGPDDSADWEASFEGADGETRETRVSVGPIIEGRARLITVTDLTPHRRRERRLYALWEFSSVVSASLDLTVLLESVSTEVCDILEARRVEFVLVDPASHSVEARAVYTADSAAPHIEFFAHQNHAALSAPVRQVLEQVETVFIDFREGNAPGREMCSITIPMVARGSVTGAFTAEDCALERHLASEHISLCHAIANQTAVAVDNVRLLSAEIEARREIGRLQEYYRTILDNSPDGVFVTDTDGTIRFWNQRMEAMFGASSDDAVGRNLFEDGFRWQAHSAAFQRVVERREPVRMDRQARVNHLDEEIVESIYFQPVRRGEEIDGILCVVMDVTDQARLERQLIKSERMAAVGELAAGVAHNFNNILAGIGGDAQLLRMIAEEESLGETVVNSADIIYRETMRGGRIAHDLLSFARGQEPVLSQVDVSALISEAVRLARTYPHAAEVELRPQIPPGLPKVSADSNQLHQVFFNIILNAIQAMPHGGTLTIDAHIVQGEDGKARMEALFSDTGVGIPEDHLNRIFDPFFSNRRGGSMGTGLGLSVSMSMIRGMDGDIRVESEMGRGTTMIVALPIVERRRRPRLGETPRTRILIADDEPNIRRTLATFLSRRGYHVVSARDGQEALDIAQEAETPFHMAIVDLLMPRMSGLETIFALRQSCPELPVVVLTGVANAEELAQVEELGITRHLGKPVDFDNLLQTVESLAGPAAAPTANR